MSSRKAQREEARQRRLAEERAQMEAARRRRRVQMLGGVIVGAIVVVVVAVVISSSGGGGPKGVATGSKQTQLVSQIENLLTGIPQSGPGLGAATAPVKLYYYGDLQCPICANFTLSSFPTLIQKDVRAGKVQVVYRSYLTATRDPQVFTTENIAALSAARQDKYWQYVELFYHQQGQEGSGYVTESFLDTLAHQVPGLDYAKWMTDRKDPQLLSQVQADTSVAVTDHVNATPTLIAQGKRGRQEVQVGVPTYDQLEQTIQAVA